ncbi:MAG TPA: alanine racemase [Quisquiliibacterium sp.]|nr:alanine racemase [Quisquiliibacterium sp.]
MTRPTTATISVAAMRHNLGRVRHHAPEARVWAVVKANAYGHGLSLALRGFVGADGLALIEFDHAQRLRESGWQGPILMLEGAFEPADLDAAADLGLELAVHCEQQLRWFEAWRASARIPVHLKLNSGMNRLGFVPDAFSHAHARLQALPAVSRVALMAHFADADVRGGADAALERFRQAARGLPGERSLANSAALIDVPGSRCDWVRPGVMLYGASPFADRSAASLDLQPAMTLSSRLIAVQSLEAGDTVGYGSTFTAPGPMRIGVVACGYADGYPRHAPTGTPVAVAGVRTRVVGRVAMDMLTVDLTPVPGADVGAEVELWGGMVQIDEVAGAAGTIGYELMCALAPRVRVEAAA